MTFLDLRSQSSAVLLRHVSSRSPMAEAARTELLTRGLVPLLTRHNGWRLAPSEPFPQHLIPRPDPLARFTWRAG
ncbi:hypothetical protein Ccr5_gp080 [Caulobacter phage Ccr5]|uniref:Uncharacterized protein n=3 Tax=Viruses TaxID=10239 RepID=K4JT59_9CAUD|nr:hypothetical protein D865_gp337 [Caulobacter phage phiCbK]AFU86913.1 hypothetical protein CbK_gp081 [Caulobacter phage phiCbK]ARB14298.1 hypothetical protein Ccr5_gp080 [Caulobacter phage Ccr5]